MKNELSAYRGRIKQWGLATRRVTCVGGLSGGADAMAPSPDAARTKAICGAVRSQMVAMMKVAPGVLPVVLVRETDRSCRQFTLPNSLSEGLSVPASEYGLVHVANCRRSCLHVISPLNYMQGA